ncbi:MAG: hypothetical protein GY796_10025, partial [Chloroflexi bacterium]|nr:hypothetical protein [Chloroflexota bacterium]
VLNWVEEIFADVVGTRLAGAEFIKSYEKLIVSRTGKKDDLKINDGTHPPDCVRPYLRTRALTKPNPKAPDWDTFFRAKFNIKEISGVQLRFFSPIAKDNLSELASRDERGDIVLTVSKLRQALEPVVDYLKGQLDTALTSTPTDVGKLPDSTFEQLKALAKSEAGNYKDVYKKLLQPRILEAGEQHTHALYGWHSGWLTYHWSSTHFH